MSKLNLHDYQQEVVDKMREASDTAIGVCDAQNKTVSISSRENLYFHNEPRRDFVAEIKRAMHETVRDVNAKEFLADGDNISREKAEEALRALGLSFANVEKPAEALRSAGASAAEAMRAFNSAALHVQMVGRALRYRPYTWRMTRSKQPRRVKIYARPPHVIDYDAEPPIVRDAAMQAICDNWEVPRG